MIGPYIVRKRWYTPPWGNYGGITLYPFILLRTGWSAELLRHELIHFWAVRRTGWFRFYGKWIWRRIRGPYREIPSEIEAYDHQHDPHYLPPELEALVRSGP